MGSSAFLKWVQRAKAKPVDPVPIISVDRGYAFFWSAKAGCTSFGRAVLSDIGAWDRYSYAADPKLSAYHPDCVSAIRREYIQRNGLTANHVEEILGRNDLYCFKVVRDPYDRAVSCFLMFMRAAMAQNQNKHHIPVSIAERFSLPRETAATFQQFAYWLTEVNIETVDLHVRPQKLRIEDDVPDLLDSVVHIESLDAELPQVEQRLNASFSEYVSERGTHAAKIAGQSDRVVADVPFEEYYKEIPPYPCFRTPEVEAIIADLYEKDYRAYGYKTRNFNG